ncbi:MAG: hypothetical protein U5R46_09160 [Gammaproteobacteria bacterium]|nr:hypothetical protein [Gammaproteobacteria bacterium]
MFFEQYSHEPNIAVARLWRFVGLAEDNRAALPEKRDKEYAARCG